MKKRATVAWAIAVLFVSGCYEVSEPPGGGKDAEAAGDAAGPGDVGLGADAGPDEGADFDAGIDAAGDAEEEIKDADLTDAGPDAGTVEDAGFDLDSGGDLLTDAGVFDDAGFDAGADTGSDADAGPDCVEESFTFEWTVTANDPLRLFELKLQNEVEYKTAEFEFEFKPTDWHGQCYNPVYNPPKLVAVNNYPLHVRRGKHWCRGGNILDSTLRSPPAGVIIASYYAEHVGSSCSGGEFFIKKASHNVEIGKTYPVKVFFDNVARHLDYDIGAERFSGPTDPNLRIVAHPNEAFYAALSHEKWLECYDADGKESPAANCCYQPSVGWTYRNFRYRICR